MAKKAVSYLKLSEKMLTGSLSLALHPGATRRSPRDLEIRYHV